MYRVSYMTVRKVYRYIPSETVWYNTTELINTFLYRLVPVYTDKPISVPTNMYCSSRYYAKVVQYTIPVPITQVLALTKKKSMQKI